jgi:Beta-lactamase
MQNALREVSEARLVMFDVVNQSTYEVPDSPGSSWARTMKHPLGRAVRSILFALLLIAISCSLANADDIACDANGCIDVNTFSANIAAKLAGNVEGYVVIVGSLPPVSGGQARTSTDPPATAMSPDLPMDIASVSKTLTAVAVLQLLPKNKDGLPIVDTKISPYIYSDWAQGPNVNQLTFSELLTHSSGFAQSNAVCTAKGVPYPCCTGVGTGPPACVCDDNNTGITYNGLQLLVAGGVQASNIGTEHALYGNCNFALLRELLPALSGQGQSISSLPVAQGRRRARTCTSPT